ncbi:MAG: LamG domain-containing protein, partial [Novosphingobium sp.]
MSTRKIDRFRTHRRKTALRASSMLSSRLVVEAIEPRLLLSADVEPITRSLDTPGSTETFTFQVTEPKKVYFDSLTDDSRLLWTLLGPNGTMVDKRAFGSSDGRDIAGSNILDLGVGEYRLTVDGQADATGVYSFRMLDIADATEITVGSRVSESNQGRETDLFKFNATAGDSFFLDRHLLSGGDVTWRLIGPDGEYVRGPETFNDSGVFTLDRTGSYTVAIEGRDSNSAAFDYAFTLSRVTTQERAVTVGEVIAEMIAGPGDSFAYRFDLAADTRLFFDALSYAPDFQWSLVGPRGEVVANRGLIRSDSVDGQPLLDLVAGSYRLTVSGYGDGAGGYAFRLLDTAGAAVIGNGAELDATFDRAYALELLERQPGAPLDYSALGTVNRAWNVDVGGPLSVADGAALRPAQLTVEAWVNGSGANYYEGAVVKSSTSGWNDGYGLVRTGNTIRFYVNGWADAYVEAPIGENIWQHVAATYDGTALRLYVDGVLAAERGYSEAIGHSSGPLLIGSSPDGYGGWSGSIDEVRVWNVARTAEQIAQFAAVPLSGGEAGLVGNWRFDEANGSTAADIAPAAVAAVATGRATEARFYRFTGQQGERWFFNLLSRSGGDLTLRVYRPDGVQLGNVISLADLELTNLPMSGDYLVAVEGRIYNNLPAAFAARLLKVADETRAIAPAGEISGHIGVGERDHLTFTLAQPTRLLFDTLTANSNLNWTLTGPRGVEVNARSFRYSDAADFDIYASALLDLPAGDYTLTVDGVGDTDSDYRFRLLDTANATSVTLGVETAGRIDPAGETDLYSFVAAAGDTLTIERIAGLNVGSPYWRLYDPTGRLVTSLHYFGEAVEVSAPMSGVYTLAIEGSIWDGETHDYSLRVNRIANVPPPDRSEGAALTPGATITASLDAADEVDLYTFTIAGPTQLYFDSLVNDTGKNWTLIGPRGVEVPARLFSRSDSYDGNPLVPLVAAGTYQLQVRGTAGSYSFRLLDLAAATAITADNSLVEGTLTPSRSTAMYRFDGAAGDTLVIDARTTISNGAMRLIDPFGREIFGASLFTDREVALPVTGSYTLLIEGRISENRASDAFTFSLNRASDPAPLALALGATVNGTIARPGDVQRYRFTIAQETVIAFDSFTNNTGLTWRLTGPGWNQMATLRASDSYEQANRPPLLLAPGEYELLIDGTLANTGDYAFRLLDLRAAATLLPGTGQTVTGALEPASETDIYAVDLAEGERFLFDAVQAPGSASFRLLDHYGRDMSGAQGFADQAFTAPRAGRYYLLIEGRISDTAASRPYSFIVDRPVNPPVQPLPLGTTFSTTIARPSEVNRFTFTLTEPKRLYLDSLTNDDRLSWSITRFGNTLAGAAFYYSDSGENGGERIIDLPAGTYEFTVSGSGFYVGTATFRLVDIDAAASAMPLGQAVAGTLSPASETDIYRFDAAAGDRLFFQNLLAVSNATVRIIDPNGRQIVGPVGLGDREFTVATTGTYFVLIEGRVWDTAAARDYRFAMHRASSPLVPVDLASGTPPPSAVQPGKIGNALVMTTHEQIEVTDPALDLREDVTIEFWLNPERMADTWTPIVYKGNDAGQRGFSVWYHRNGYIHVSTQRGGSDDALATANNSVPMGQWTHVTAVIERSTGNLHIYLNGELAVTRTIATTPHNGSAATPLYIGASSETNDAYQKFEGAIDELRVWNRSRSAAEVQADLLKGAPTDASGLVLRMDFDVIAAGRLTERVSGATIPLLRDLEGLAGVVEGRLLSPGDTRSYSFTLAAPTLMAFDALHDNNAMTVTITGPGGVSIARNMRNGESHEFGSGNPAFQLAAGNYTVTVDGNGAATGAFAFRLVDLGRAPLLASGSAVSGRMTGSADNAAWRIEAAAGDRLFIDLQQFSGAANGATFRLIDPLGRQLYGPVNAGDFTTAPLAYGGVYTLMLEGRAALSNWPVDYRLAAYALPVSAPIPIALDGPNPDAPKVVGGVSGQALALRGVDYVEVADGADVDITRNLTVEGWFFFERATDTWMPVVSKGLNATSPYRIAINSSGAIWGAVRDASGVQSVQSAGGVVPFGEWVHLALVADRDDGAMQLLVNGEARASLAIRTNANANTDDPLYIAHYTQAEGSYGPVEGAVDSFRLWSTARSAAQISAGMGTPPPAGTPGLNLALDFETTALPAGVTLRSVNANGVTGRIAVPGEEVRYAFTLDKHTFALFDSLTDNSSLRWTLTGPEGVEVDARRFDQSDSSSFSGSPVLKLGPGAYVLTVAGTADFTGAFNFRLSDLANATPLALGTRVAAPLTPANATAAYRFAANAGESFFFDALGSVNGVRWRLIDPAGNLVFNQTTLTDIDGLKLDVTGTYTLLIEGVVGQGTVASYDFAIYPMAVQDAPLTIGQRVAAAISQPGESDRYSFTLAQPTRLLLDSFTNSSTLNWTLTGPDGTVVSARRFDQSDSVDLSGNPVLNLSAGTWTLTVDGAGQAVGDYAFQLRDLATAEEMAAGNYARSLSESGRKTDLYRFDAIEGMRFGFVVPPNGANGNYWRLIDPLGQVVFGSSVLSSTGLLTATMAGSYTLLVEGRVSRSADSAYNFVFDVASQPPANGATAQDFEAAGGLPFVLGNHQGLASQVLDEGGNRFVRLTEALNPNSHNSVYFSAT